MTSQILHKLFGILPQGDAFSYSFTSYTFILPYQCELMNIYSILWIIIQYYFFVVVAQFNSSLDHRELFQLALVSLGYLPIVVNF